MTCAIKEGDEVCLILENGKSTGNVYSARNVRASAYDGDDVCDLYDMTGWLRNGVPVSQLVLALEWPGKYGNRLPSNVPRVSFR